MANFLSPGTKLLQTAKGPVVARAVSTAIGGFLLYCPKGPVGKAVLVTGTDDSKEVFGSRFPGGSPGVSRLADSLLDFFNEGGSACYVIRYIGAGSAVASRGLTTPGGPTSGSESSSPASFPIGLFAGGTFTAQVDGVGGPLTATIVASRASITGSAATYAAVTAGHNLTVHVQGVPIAQVITFAGTENTEALFITAINTQLRGGRAVDSGGQIKIEADVEGSSSTGSIAGSSSADVLTSLGLTAGPFTPGAGDVANVDAITAAEMVAIFNAAFTGSTTTPNANGSITWKSNTTGGSSSVQFTGGTATGLVPGFDLLLHSGGATAPVATITITAAAGTDPSPGTWANSYGTFVTQNNVPVTTVNATAAGSTSTIVVAFSGRLAIGDTISITKILDTERAVISNINGNVITLATPITVPVGGYAGSEAVVLETWNLTVYNEAGNVVFPSPFKNLRMSPLAGANYFVNVINGSPRVPINVVDLAPVLSDPRPSVDSIPVLLTGGSDGSPPTASNAIAQIQAFNQASNVNFICMPGCNTDFTGSNGVAILKAFEAYGINRDDVQVVLPLPKGTPPTGSGGARDYVQNTANLASRQEIVIWPWIKSPDVVTGVVTLFPPEPHLLGIIARTHAARNFGRCPAGDPIGLVQSRAVGLEYEIGEQSVEYDDMYPAGVNAFLRFSDGICFFGDRTMDPTGEIDQIQVQTGFNIDKRIARQATRFVNFENNNPDTRAAVVKVLTSVYRAQRIAKILQGASDNEAFFVQCDDKNNTALVIQSGKMVIRHGLAFQRASEFVEETFEQDTRAVDAALAALSA